MRGARIVLGAVAPVPWRSPAAEAALKGKRLTEETATAAADAAVKGAKPMTQNAYKSADRAHGGEARAAAGGEDIGRVRA